MNIFNLKYGKFFSLPRKSLKYGTSLLYPIVINLWQLPKVISIEETLGKIISDKSSIVRFGDGEILYIVDSRNLPFQNYEQQLAEKLKKILISNHSELLVGLPDAYRGKKPSTFWRSQITWCYPRLKKNLDMSKVYYNAMITRLYYGTNDIEKSRRNFDLIKQIWAQRKIIIIEGEKTRFGVGNDLLDDAKSIRRILGPYHHAFSRYKEILNEVLKYDQDNLILVSMGPAAKVIVYELFLKGYQAIDIGNLDIEYEWFLRGVEERIKIPGKYTSEVKGGRVVEDINDPVYNSQIVATFI